MAPTDNNLTATQFEILQFLWDAEVGLTVAELWDAVRTKRRVGRTTVLNLVDRLEKRGWLSRQKVDGTYRYRPTVSRSQTESELTEGFLSAFFDGSAANLFLSLLGSKRVSKADIERLKRLLENDSVSSRHLPPERGKQK